MQHQKVESVSSGAIGRFPVARINAVNRLLSVAAVMAIVIGLAGAAWIYVDRRGGGSGDDHQQLVAATGTPESEWGVSFLLPTTSDCTVEALSTEQAIDKIDTIDTSLVPMFPDESGHMMITENAEGTPVLPGEPLSFQEVSPEVSAEIIAAQRQFLACSMVGSASQAFALVSNDYLQKRLINQFLPAISSDSIRSSVVSMMSEESVFASGAYSWDPDLTNVWLPMVSDDQTGIQYIDNNQYQVSIQIRWMMFDGTVTHFEADLPEGMGELERSLPDVWTFVKDEETGVWQLDSMRNARDVINPRRS